MILPPRVFDDGDKLQLSELGILVEQEIVAIQFSTTDQLTGLSNRRGFHSLAQMSLQQCIRKARSCSLLVIEVSDLQIINQQFGYDEGDCILKNAVRLLVSAFPEADVFGRIGGNTLAVYISDSDEQSTQLCLTEFNNLLGAYNAGNEKNYNIGFLSGSVQYVAGKIDTIGKLLECAEQLIYLNKEHFHK